MHHSSHNAKESFFGSLILHSRPLDFIRVPLNDGKVNDGPKEVVHVCQ